MVDTLSLSPAIQLCVLAGETGTPLVGVHLPAGETVGTPLVGVLVPLYARAGGHPQGASLLA